MWKYKLILILYTLHKIQLFRYILKQYLGTISAKFSLRKHIERILKALINLKIVIVNRWAHGENLSEFTITCEVNKVYALDIDALKAIMRKCKDVEWQIQPNISFELSDWDSSVKWVCDDSFARSSWVKNQSSFYFIRVRDCNFNVNILSWRNVDLKDQEWLQKTKTIFFWCWNL